MDAVQFSQETMDGNLGNLLKGKALAKIAVVSPSAFVKWENLTWKSLYSVVICADLLDKRTVSFGHFDNVPYFTAHYRNSDGVVCGVVLSCSINKEADCIRGAYVVLAQEDVKIVQRIPKTAFADVSKPFANVAKRLKSLADKHLALRGQIIAEKESDRSGESVETLRLALAKAEKRDATLKKRSETKKKAGKAKAEKAKADKAKAKAEKSVTVPPASTSEKKENSE